MKRLVYSLTLLLVLGCGNPQKSIEDDSISRKNSYPIKKAGVETNPDSGNTVSIVIKESSFGRIQLIDRSLRMSSPTTETVTVRLIVPAEANLSKTIIPGNYKINKGHLKIQSTNQIFVLKPKNEAVSFPTDRTEEQLLVLNSGSSIMTNSWRASIYFYEDKKEIYIHLNGAMLKSSESEDWEYLNRSQYEKYGLMKLDLSREEGSFVADFTIVKSSDFDGVVDGWKYLFEH